MKFVVDTTDLVSAINAVYRATKDQITAKRVGLKAVGNSLEIYGRGSTWAMVSVAAQVIEAGTIGVDATDFTDVMSTLKGPCHAELAGALVVKSPIEMGLPLTFLEFDDYYFEVPPGVQFDYPIYNPGRITYPLSPNSLGIWFVDNLVLSMDDGGYRMASVTIPKSIGPTPIMVGRGVFDGMGSKSFDIAIGQDGVHVYAQSDDMTLVTTTTDPQRKISQQFASMLLNPEQSAYLSFFIDRETALNLLPPIAKLSKTREAMDTGTCRMSISNGNAVFETPQAQTGHGRVDIPAYDVHGTIADDYIYFAPDWLWKAIWACSGDKVQILLGGNTVYVKSTGDNSVHVIMMRSPLAFKAVEESLNEKKKSK